MPTKSAPFKIDAKVAGIYWGPRGTCWDPSGIVTKCDSKQVTVTYKSGEIHTYSLPATDYLDHLRICTSCGKPSSFKRCIGNGGCGAPTEAA